MARKAQFMTKTTSFGGKKVILYSIDGIIWSTRKDELAVIKHRLDTQKVTLDLSQKEDEEGKDSEKKEGEEGSVEGEGEIAPIETDETPKAAKAKADLKAKNENKAQPLKDKKTKSVKPAKLSALKAKKASKRKAA